MNTIDPRSMTPIGALPAPLVVALGTFDGVHTAHQRLLAETARLAKEMGAYAAVWTLISSHKSAPELTSFEEKCAIFAQHGIDCVVTEPFDAVRDLSPEEFIEKTLKDTLHCTAAVCGFNFRFGKGAAGDAALFESLCRAHGILPVVIPAVTAGGDVVSSTRVRRAAFDGDMALANALLGHPFSLTAPVLHGKQLGRTLGIPTVNQNFPADHLVPKTGIYACRVYMGGKAYRAVANVGHRPTVSNGSDTINCETHIIGFDGDLYGKVVRVEFLARLRGEQKFPSLEALQSAIKQDIASTIRFFEEQKGTI